jgi:hypothetical protein
MLLTHLTSRNFGISIIALENSSVIVSQSAFTMKMELLNNAIEVDDAIRFVAANPNQILGQPFKSLTL